MKRVGILGAGNVGANAAFFIAERRVADVILYDAQEGLSTGKALDLMEAAPVRSYRSWLHGTDAPDSAAYCDVVVIAAGESRKPGEERATLAKRNRNAVAALARGLHGSDAVVVVATEPVDEMTAVVQKESGLPRSRVLGIGGILDAARLRTEIAEAIGVSAEDVDARVIGPHNAQMIPMLQYTAVSGIPVADLLTETELEAAVARTLTAGDRILEGLQRTAGFYGSAAAITDVVEAVCRNSGRILDLSCRLEGEYGIRGVTMSVPVIVGKNGAEQILDLDRTPEQQQQLDVLAKEAQR